MEAKEARVDSAVEKGEDAHGEGAANLMEGGGNAGHGEDVPAVQRAEKDHAAEYREALDMERTARRGLPDCIHRVVCGIGSWSRREFQSKIS
jgi:hypothetical protein